MADERTEPLELTILEAQLVFEALDSFRRENILEIETLPEGEEYQSARGSYLMTVMQCGDLRQKVHAVQVRLGSA